MREEKKKLLNNLMVLPKHLLTPRKLYAGWLGVLSHSDIAFDWFRFSLAGSEEVWANAGAE